MDKDLLLQKIKSKNYTHDQLLAWVNTMPPAMEKRKPIEYKVGDCLMHAVFKHPYILLKKRKEDWLCGLLTSDGGYPDIIDKCQSRFFADKYITKSLFVATKLEGSFINTYENNKHLREVLTKLREVIK